MSDNVIEVRNLSKRYIIGQEAKSNDGLRHVLERAIKAPFARLKNSENVLGANTQEFWALRDVDFDLKQGEVLGIIGRNGAGKSTMLKLLSRITEPTMGSIRLKGRVASLLEVGTGFHPELTGRENIYLNGAILGMSRLEIKRKFDEIVAFSEVEKFLDTPVKRYSSGMYVRLAFAVAAHLEPEILIVDEVLAVGDAQFQKKCLDKMDDVGGAGRTVIFVSHNMQAVTRLCSRAILLEKGRIKMDDTAHLVANRYFKSDSDAYGVREWNDPNEAPGNHVVRLRSMRTIAHEGASQELYDIRTPIGIVFEYEVLEPGHILLPHFGLINEEGLNLFIACDVDEEWRGRERPVGRYTSVGWIPGNYLAEGAFSVRAALITLDDGEVAFNVKDAVMFRVADDLTASDTARGDYQRPLAGVVRPKLAWMTKHEQASPVEAIEVR